MLSVYSSIKHIERLFDFVGVLQSKPHLFSSVRPSDKQSINTNGQTKQCCSKCTFLTVFQKRQFNIYILDNNNDDNDGHIGQWPRITFIFVYLKWIILCILSMLFWAFKAINCSILLRKIFICVCVTTHLIILLI